MSWYFFPWNFLEIVSPGMWSRWIANSNGFQGMNILLLLQIRLKISWFFGPCVILDQVWRFSLTFEYCKVASSRPVYYSILNSFGQRSQYISIEIPIQKQSNYPWMCYFKPREFTTLDLTVIIFFSIFLWMWNTSPCTRQQKSAEVVSLKNHWDTHVNLDLWKPAYKRFYNCLLL